MRPVGSRLPFDYAKETGANFLGPGALEAARARTSFVERHQSFDHKRLWADLLSSRPSASTCSATWPPTSGLPNARFTRGSRTPRAPCARSASRTRPGRLDSAFLGNLVAWDVAFVLDLGDGTEGIVGVVTAYHEVNRPQPPKPTRPPAVPRGHRDVGQLRAGSARRGQRARSSSTSGSTTCSCCRCCSTRAARGAGAGSSSSTPAGNTDFADACERYRDLLVDDTTFALGDRRAATRRRSPPGADDRSPARAVPARLTG